MNKTFIKSLIYSFLTLSFAFFFFTSCSTDDKDPAIVFTSLEANKTQTYIESAITLNFSGTGYSDISVTSTNTAVKITKTSSTSYEISSTIATSANIVVALKNNSYNESKNITLNFYEHGIKNFNTVEGIKVDVDLSSKITTLLGEAENKTNSTDGLTEYWYYYTKGISFSITKLSSIVNQIDLYSSNYYYVNSANTQTSYTNYPYEIGNSWKINNSTTTMDMIVTQLGIPNTKGTSTTSSTNRYYQYSAQNIVFRFYSDSEDNYTGKKIIYFSVY